MIGQSGAEDTPRADLGSSSPSPEPTATATAPDPEPTATVTATATATATATKTATATATETVTATPATDPEQTKFRANVQEGVLALVVGLGFLVLLVAVHVVGSWGRRGD